MKYQKGNSSDLAETIIDYESKTVQILDPDTKEEVKNASFSLDSFSFILHCGLTVLAIMTILSLYNDFYYTWLLAPITIIIGIFYIIKLKSRRFNEWYHYHEQNFFDLVRPGRYAEFTNIATIDWKFPYKFRNIKFEYHLYGDYKKFIKKIHIYPKPYYEIDFEGTKSIQLREWEILIYFTKIPKNGKMELYWK